MKSYKCKNIQQHPIATLLLLGFKWSRPERESKSRFCFNQDWTPRHLLTHLQIGLTKHGQVLPCRVCIDQGKANQPFLKLQILCPQPNSLQKALTCRKHNYLLFKTGLTALVLLHLQLQLVIFHTKLHFFKPTPTCKLDLKFTHWFFSRQIGQPSRSRKCLSTIEAMVTSWALPGKEPFWLHSDASTPHFHIPSQSSCENTSSHTQSRLKDYNLMAPIQSNSSRVQRYTKVDISTGYKKAGFKYLTYKMEYQPQMLQNLKPYNTYIYMPGSATTKWIKMGESNFFAYRMASSVWNSKPPFKRPGSSSPILEWQRMAGNGSG